MRPSDRRREGNDYVVTWDGAGIELVFTRLRETSTSIFSEVIARVAGGGGRIMAPTKVNLFEMKGRQTLAAALLKRVEGGPSMDEWAEGMEYAYGFALDCYRDLGPLIDLAEHPLTEDQGYLFENLIARNELNILVADQGASKSYLLLYLLVCGTLGLNSVFGKPAVMGPSIYYDTETSADSHRRRLERISRGLGLSRLPSIKYRRLQGRLIDHEAFILAEVARLGATNVAVDSLTYAAGGDLNDMALAGPTINMIANMGENVTKLVAAHHSKQQRGGEAKDASAMGSALYELKARSLWVLKRESGGTDTRDLVSFNVLMTNKKMSDGPTEKPQVYEVAFDNVKKSTVFARGEVANLRELESEGMTPGERAYHLLQKEEPLGVRDVAEYLSISVGSAKRELNGLALQQMARNINRSVTGPSKAGLWVHIPPAERGCSGVQPLSTEHLNGASAPNGAHRSAGRSDDRSEHRSTPFSVNTDPPRMPYRDDIENLSF